MVTINTNLKNPRESARTERVEQAGGITATTVQGALQQVNASITSSAVSTPLTLNTTTGTLGQGLLISSTLTNSGSTTGVFNFNEIDAINPGYVNSGTNTDSYGLLPAINALRINLQSGNTNGPTIPAALTVATKATTTSNPNLVGAQLTAYTNINSSNDALWGGLGFVNVDSGGNVLVTQAFDCESRNAGTVAHRFGCMASSFGPNQATAVDSAFGLLQATFRTDTPKPWKNVLTLFDGYTGSPAVSPIDSNGNVIFAGGVGNGTFSTGNFVYMPNVTFSSYIFNLKNFTISANGVGTITGPSGSAIWTATTSSGGSVALYASVNGASGFNGIQVTESSLTKQLGNFQFESSNSAIRFGQSSGGWAGVFQFTGGSGLMLGTRNAAPVIIGANDTAILSLTSSGGVQVDAPTGGDKGIGTLNAKGLYVNGGTVGVLAFTSLVNFNVSNTDTPITITIPANISRYKVEVAFISGANTSLTTATLGIFTSTGGAGSVIVPTGALTVATGAENTNNNLQTLTVSNASTQAYTVGTLYSRVSSAEGVAATANVTIEVRPLG